MRLKGRRTVVVRGIFENGSWGTPLSKLRTPKEGRGESHQNVRDNVWSDRVTQPDNDVSTVYSDRQDIFFL